eukprot:7346683-Prymnesium_polylepis.1
MRHRGLMVVLGGAVYVYFFTTELIYTCADRSTARCVPAHKLDAALPGTRRGEGGRDSGRNGTNRYSCRTRERP